MHVVTRTLVIVGSALDVVAMMLFAILVKDVTVDGAPLGPTGVLAAIGLAVGFIVGFGFVMTGLIITAYGRWKTAFGDGVRHGVDVAVGRLFDSLPASGGKVRLLHSHDRHHRS